MTSTAKRLNEMNRLRDVEQFPVPVMLGATANVLLTMAVVWHFEPPTDHSFLALPAWIAGVLVLNLLPVILLRLLTLRPDTVYPVIQQMDFFRDQHKFSDWVYLMPSANMALWISVTWMTSYYRHTQQNILLAMAAAIVVTLSPVWVRLFRG